MEYATKSECGADRPMSEMEGIVEGMRSNVALAGRAEAKLRETLDRLTGNAQTTGSKPELAACPSGLLAQSREANDECNAALSRIIDMLHTLEAMV